jgi:small GTP-binding protein
MATVNIGQTAPIQEAMRAQERAALAALRDAIEPLGPDAGDVGALRQAEADLEEMFLLVIVGEFNSGKSSFINALLGEDVLPEGVTPTTASINILRYGPQPTEVDSSDFVVERTYPAGFLRDISIVDTPGTNAIIRRHEELTRHFVPRSDLVLFITSADRPFTESERGFMETIREWGKKIVVILNKVDLLSNQEEVDRVLHFIEEHSVQLLGQQPLIFPVSARLAKRAQAAEGFVERDALLQASRFPALERFIFETLDEASRIRLKLLTPLGIADRVIAKYSSLAEARLEVLREDARTVENIDRQLHLYVEDMRRDFLGRIAEIENIIFELRERGNQFFEETLRPARVRDLVSSDRIQREFEDKVVADTARRIDDSTNSLIAWMVDKELRLWQGISEYLTRRRGAGGMGESEHVIGPVVPAGNFETSRQALLATVVGEARQVVGSYDRRAEAGKIADDMRSAVAQVVAAGGVAALGLIVSLAVTGAFVDITGVTAAIVSGAVALFVIPYKKRRAQAEFRERTDELRVKLIGAMTRQFEMELTRSVDRIREAVAPYTRFVTVERDRIGTAQARIGDVRAEVGRLKNRIEEIGTQPSNN